MATIKLLLVLFCAACFGRGWGADRGFVNDDRIRKNGDKVGAAILATRHEEAISVGRGRLLRHFVPRNDDAFAIRNVGFKAARNDVLRAAQSQLQVREKTGRNDGAEVEVYLAYVGFKKGDPWCAAFVSWCFWKAGYAGPRTAWSPALFPAARLVKEPKPGDVTGIYFPELKRIAHCGLLEKMQGDFCQSIEGNTNSQGGREGNGVFRRLRHRRTIKAFANWLY